MWCGAVLDYFYHRILRYGLAKTIIVSHLVFAVICAVYPCSVVLSLAKIITALHFIFAVTCAILCIKCGLKSVYFSNFGFFLLSPKLIFPFFWAKMCMKYIQQSIHISTYLALLLCYFVTDYIIFLCCR